jgi:2-dehydro-3-deoxygluconokinase
MFSIAPYVTMWFKFFSSNLFMLWLHIHQNNYIIINGMNKVFCFGELLLRMSPALNGRWMQDAQMPVYIGGAELNAATALANWNIPVRYCTALPNNDLSREITTALQHKYIDTSAIQFSGSRIGIYYLPQGADLKNAGVIYDRSGSSFAELKPGTINWDVALDGCTWFHFSAICPALNEQAAAVCKEAVQAASAKGLTVSVDLNYRARLWQYGKQPQPVMRELMPYCQVVMGNIWAAEQLLGIAAPVKESSGVPHEQLLEAAGTSMLQLHQTYPNITTMAYTFRLEDSYFGVLQHGPARAVSQTFLLTGVIDKAGSGDCFMAGLIYGLYQQHLPKTIIDFAAAAAVGKMKEKGDATRQTVEAVNNYLLTQTVSS